MKASTALLENRQQDEDALFEGQHRLADEEKAQRAREQLTSLLKK